MKKYININIVCLFFLILTNTVYGGLISIVPIISGVIIDYGSSQIGKYTETSRMGTYCLMSLGLLFLIILSGLIKVALKAKYIKKTRRQIEKDLFETAIRSNISSSALVNMFCTEVDLIINKYYSNHGELACILVQFAIALSYSVSVSWQTILVIAICFLVLILLNQLLLLPMSKFMEMLSRNNENVNKVLLGFLSSITSLKIYGGIDFAFQHIQTALVERNRVETSKTRYELIVDSVNCLFSTLLQIIPLLIVSIMVVNGELAVGAALSIMLLFEKIVSPIDSISNIRMQYSETKGFRKKIEEVISGNDISK